MTEIKTYFKKDFEIERDKTYLAFIRSLPCLVCGLNAVAHHEPLKKNNGTAIKGSDRETIPLCHEHHNERHQTGKSTFAKKYYVNYDYEVRRLQLKFKGR